MTWLILLLALVVVIGPVLYLVPSEKDKRLSKLRELARTQGLSVKLSQVAKLDPQADERVSAGGVIKRPSTSCVAYQLPLQGLTTSALADAGDLTLLKVPGNPTVPVEEVLPGWALADAEDRQNFLRLFDATQRQELLGSLEEFPEDTLAFGLSARTVACYWLEKSSGEDGRIEDMRMTLGQIGQLMERYFG